ncbi:DegV family protein [Eubacteriales bacterium OttesenSCG-928-K08]|nr:DegV family protein [Eubacteriales bacterium OttesenSCG-928-K08]
MRLEHSYAICTDTGADIPWRTAQVQQLEIAHLHYTMDDAAYIYDLGRETDLTAFYYAMRNSVQVKTIPVLPEAFCSMWNPVLVSGRDVLYLSLSGAMSSSFQSAQVAREQMRLLHPERRIILVDTCSCSLAQGMLVFEAAQMRAENRTIDDVAGWVVENRKYTHGLLFPEERDGLRAAGLYSGNAINELLGRQTLFSLGANGGLNQAGHFKTRQEALRGVLDYVRSVGYALENQVVGVVHADVPEKAEKLCWLLKKHAGCTQTMIMPMGPIIGAYARPGALGVAFFGSRR